MVVQSANADPSTQGETRKVAFVKEDQAWIVNADGSDLTQVSHEVDGVYKVFWSGDGSHLFLITRQIHVVSMNLDGGDRELVWDPERYEPQTLDFQVSPDGTRVAFTDGNLKIANADTLEGVVTFPPFASMPSWSPDSTELVFTQGIVGTVGASIGIVNVATGVVSHVADITEGAWAPSFTPDGEHILFTSSEGPDVNAYLVDRDGSNLRSFTSKAHFAAFSPDGGLISFAKDEAGFDVYVANPDGSDPRRVAPGPAAYLKWQPAPLAPSTTTTTEDPTTTTTAPSTTTTSLPPETTTTTSTTVVAPPTTTTAPPKANVAPVVRGKFAKISSPEHTLLADGGTSTDSDGTIDHYMWVWGDGSRSFTRRAWHTYTTPGTYLVRLVVVDNKGATSIGGVWIRIP